MSIKKEMLKVAMECKNLPFITNEFRSELINQDNIDYRKHCFNYHIKRLGFIYTHYKQYTEELPYLDMVSTDTLWVNEYNLDGFNQLVMMLNDVKKDNPNIDIIDILKLTPITGMELKLVKRIFK